MDVVVTNQGTPVHGLVQSSFHVFDDDQEQKVATFDEHSAPSQLVRQAVAPLPTDTYTNIRRYPAATALNVILLDSLNTPVAAQANAQAQLELFLRNARPGVPTEVFKLDTGLHLIAGFSEEPAVLARTVKLASLLPQASSLYDPESEKQRADVIAATPAQAIKQAPQLVDSLKEMSAMINSDRAHNRVTMTVQAFAQLARILESVRGRKNLIWISGSFPISIEPDTSLKDPFYAWQNFGGELNQAAKRLAAAQVAIYPIDARGHTGLPSANALDRYNASIGNVDQNHVVHAAGESDDMKFLSQSSDERASMRQIANATGGKPFVNTNAIAGAISSAEEDGANYYSLGYVPVKTKLDGKFHNIKVKIDGASYHLAYRNGYLADTLETVKKNAPVEVPAVLASTVLGAPPATQIGIVARIVPADSTEAQDIVLDDKTPGVAVSSPQENTWRRYLATLLIDPHDIVFELANDGTRTATLELALITFNRYGKSMSDMERHVKLRIPADRFEPALKNGLPVRFGLNLPIGFGFLRIAVHDPVTNRVGSVEFPVSVPGKP